MGQPTVALLGTARNDFVLAAAGALRQAGAAVTVLVQRGREARFVDESLPVRTFTGRVAWYSLPLLAALRGVGAKRIAVVVGDQFAHANVTTALNWWRAAGLLRGADIYVSSSTQPAVLEGFNSIDQRQWLGAGGAAVLAVAVLVEYPVVALVGAVVASGLELAARRARAWTARERPADRTSAGPILVDDPRLGWRLRPARITARVTTPDAAPRTVRVTIDAGGQRTTGAACGAHDRRPLIAFYGGSSVFGDALSDEETIPWRTATLLTQCRVLNRAVPGYCALQALTRLLDDFADHTPAAVVVILDQNGPTVTGHDSANTLRVPNPGHARFALSDRFAAWFLIRRMRNRSREQRSCERALRAVGERCAREGIPLVHSTLGEAASPESVAELLAQKVSAALDDRQRR